MKYLSDILADPAADGGRILVEIYLNYDCDVEAGARENIWERLVNSLSKLLSQPIDPSQNGAYSVTANKQVPSINGMLPAITTATLSNLTKEQVRTLYSATGDSLELKRYGLELIVNGCLKPLSAWCDRKIKEEKLQAEKQANETKESGETSEEAKTKVQVDFKNLKQKKQTLTEGIEKFNAKPKKVPSYCLPY